VAVIDAHAMAQTFGALVQGLADEAARSGVRMIGAIANRVAGEGHARILAESIRPPQRLWGALPRVAAMLPERHLGLASEDYASVDSAIEALTKALMQPLIGEPLALPPPVAFDSDAESDLQPLLQQRHIAVACDEAFRFIYPANLALLHDLGARLSFFSPVADSITIAGRRCDMAAWRLSGAARGSAWRRPARGRTPCGGTCVPASLSWPNAAD